ncbi:MAG: HDIG domain-containing protein [Armatimonadetes bacterium]|nr:HDIG domain-containing protein [Armatimonadota bacterium]
MSGRQRHKRNPRLVIWRRWGDWRKLAVGVVTGGLIALLLTTRLAPDKVNLRVGDAARDDIRSPRYLQYRDERETDRQRQLAAASVVQYSTIPDAAVRVDQRINLFFQQASQLRVRDRGGSLDEQARVLQASAPPGLPVTSIRQALLLAPARRQKVAQAARQLAREGMSGPVRRNTDDLSRTQALLRARAAALPLSPTERELTGEVAALSLEHNLLLNAEETARARERARQSVPPVVAEIRADDILIHKGEIVTAEHLELLERLGLRQPRTPSETRVYLALLGFGLVVLFGNYLYQFHLRLFRDLRALVLISVVTIGCLFIFRLGSAALGLKLSGDQMGYVGMMCSALAAMLVAALLSPQVAVFVGMAMAFLTALLVDNQLKFAMVGLVSSLAGVQAVTNIRDRAGILRAALAVCVANVLVILVAHGATVRYSWPELGVGVAWGMIGGLASVFLFVPAAALLERPFGLTTHLRLLELSDPNHPLLRRLAMEAPGTYAHSIVVGNLSEAAAKAIGADALFARVASYYHDIGKVVRPQFFVENQTAENRHAQINPSLSCLVVTAHVKDGVQLAEQSHLPPPIVNIIREHHGTCLIKYFYHRAMRTGSEDPAPGLEYQFRYEGPRPRTKESGIIMLADASEATSRTLEKPTPGRMRAMVETIVRDRLSDGQLDECELTFRDLEKIITTFTRTLSSMLHARIEYPEADTTDLLRWGADGTAGKEPTAALHGLSDTPEGVAGALTESPGA